MVECDEKRGKKKKRKKKGVFLDFFFCLFIIWIKIHSFTWLMNFLSISIQGRRMRWPNWPCSQCNIEIKTTCPYFFGHPFFKHFLRWTEFCFFFFFEQLINIQNRTCWQVNNFILSADKFHFLFPFLNSHELRQYIQR